MVATHAHLPGYPADWWETFEDPPGGRVEIVQGELVVSPSPTFRHQLLATRLAALLEAASPSGHVAVVDMEWRLDVAGMVAQAPRPDVLVAQPEGSTFALPPLLAVEVLSPSDDQTLIDGRTRFEGKASDYRRNGLAHLLVVQPDLGVVFLLAGDEEGWTEISRTSKGDTFETDVPFPFAVRIEEMMTP